MRITVIDTETTGLCKGCDVNKGHRIIQISAVEIVDYKITGKTFNKIVDPEMEITPKATEIHGLRTEDVKGKEKFEDIVKDFVNFISGSLIVIHNAPFDIAFIDQEFKRLPIEMQPTETFEYFDTLEVARHIYPYEDNTLKGLCERYDIQYSNGHDALSDSIMLAKIYLRMLYGI